MTEVRDQKSLCSCERLRVCERRGVDRSLDGGVRERDRRGAEESFEGQRLDLAPLWGKAVWH